MLELNEEELNWLIDECYIFLSMYANQETAIENLKSGIISAHFPNISSDELREIHVVRGILSRIEPNLKVL